LKKKVGEGATIFNPLRGIELEGNPGGRKMIPGGEKLRKDWNKEIIFFTAAPSSPITRSTEEGTPGEVWQRRSEGSKEVPHQQLRILSKLFRRRSKKSLRAIERKTE